MRGGKYISIGCTVCYHICIKDYYRKSCKKGGKWTVYADLLTVDSSTFSDLGVLNLVSSYKQKNTTLKKLSLTSSRIIQLNLIDHL